jgi:tRNA threonylcarbamoyladenosine biosynthesis protein TsaE
VSEPLTVELADVDATVAFGRRLATALAKPSADGLTIWLEGELGAGKTTLVRAVLRALGHTGRVPSPTYTLVEPYELAAGTAHHVDLYRLQDPAEAELLGLAELPVRGGWLLVEWPERGAGFLPRADVRLQLGLSGEGRVVRVSGPTAAGKTVLRALAEA